MRARTSTPPQEKRTSSFRPDIQGLRALAVLAVISDHLFRWPSGGFVGVDVFFVISGFLITGHLVTSYEQTGRISFINFYLRRAKRILPVAVLVILATIVTSFLLFNQARAANVVWDGFWALLFGANWRQASVGTDYFASGEPVSPLQHYWSLAVEEQFYFLWPWLMLLLFTLSRFAFRHRTNPRLTAGLAMITLACASFVWSVWETSANPTLAYFSTFSRSWELGAGALLAIATPLLNRIPAAIRPFLSWMGLFGITISLFVIDSQTEFPGPGALLPVISTAFVLAAGTGNYHFRHLSPLTNGVSSYLGNISYSLYLWHFPVIIFADSIYKNVGTFEFIVLLAAILLLSIFSYHLLEDPIRKSAWLTAKRVRRHNDDRFSPSFSYKVTALLALASVTGVVVAPQLLNVSDSRTTFIAPPRATSTPSPTATDNITTPEVSALQKQIGVALQSTTWPVLNPTMDESLAEHPQLPGVMDCGNNVAPATTECVWGDPNADKTMLLAGDSVAVSWVPALAKAFGESGWRILMRANHGCPFREHTENTDKCLEHLDAVVTDINKLKPDVLLIANNYPDSGSLSGWTSGLNAILGKSAGAKSTIMLSSAPHSTDPQECYRPGSAPMDCVTNVPNWYFGLIAAERASVEAAGGEYQDTYSLFCSPDNVCPSFADETPMKMDEIHMTFWYSEKISSALAELLKPKLG